MQPNWKTSAKALHRTFGGFMSAADLIIQNFKLNTMVRKFYEADDPYGSGGSIKPFVNLSLPLVQVYEKLMEAHNILAKSDLSMEDYGYYSRLLVQMKIKLQDTIHSGNAS